MSKSWNREELELAFKHYVETARNCAHTGSWGELADLFTDNLRYFSNGDLVWQSRNQLRNGIIEFYSEFPFSQLGDFELIWHVIDEENGRVVFAMNAVMTDPGDGSSLSAYVLIHIQYAGDNQWAFEEDWFKLDDYTQMAEQWTAIRAADSALE